MTGFRLGGLRRLAPCALACAALLALPAAGYADTVHVDVANGSDHPQCGSAGDPCETIAQGIGAAGSGDTVQVAPGTYHETYVDIDKDVSLVGAGAGETVIDGGAATDLPTGGTVNLTAQEGAVSLSGVTIRNAGTPHFHAAPTEVPVALYVRGPMDLPPGPFGAAPTYTVSDIEIEGRGAGARDYGVYCERSRATFVLEGSVIANTDFNPILVELCTGAIDVRGNEIEKTPGTTPASAVFAMAYGGSDVTEPQRVRDNQITGSVVFNGSFAGGSGTYTDVAITGNEVSAPASGVVLSNWAGGTPANGQIDGAVVSGNTLTGSGGGSGVLLRGWVTDTEITQNTVAGFGFGVRAIAEGAGFPEGTVATVNRLAANDVGASNEGAGLVDARNNWWGCDGLDDPTGAECGKVSGPVDASPWIVLSIAADPTEVERDEPSEISVDLLHNSDGDQVPAGLPDGGSVAFSTTLGEVSPDSATLEDHEAGTTFSSSTSGTATVSATLDGGTSSTQVIVRAPPPTCTLIHVRVALLGMRVITVCI